MILQLNSAINGGSVSADWTLTGMTIIVGTLIGFVVIIVGWVFVSTLTSIKEELKGLHKRVDTRESEHDELNDKHIALATRVVLVESHQKTHAEHVANVIINKLYAANPPGKRHPHLPEEES